MSSELFTSVEVVVIFQHLQNQHQSPAAAGPVPGFGNEGQPTSHKFESSLMGDFQGTSRYFADE